MVKSKWNFSVKCKNSYRNIIFIFTFKGPKKFISWTFRKDPNAKLFFSGTKLSGDAHGGTSIKSDISF